MEHIITILTLSRKWGGKCVAGYDHNDNRLIRLVSNVQGKQLENYRTSEINLLDVITVEIKCKCPFEHQKENICIPPKAKLKKTGVVSYIEDFDFLVRSDGRIFGDCYYKIADTSDIDHSVEIVRFRRMSIHYDGQKTKADFYVGGNLHKWYRVTDIVHEGKTTEIAEGYAVITLPPTDEYASKNGYFKYIAAIYPIN